MIAVVVALLDAPSAQQLVAADESESNSSRQNRHANCGVRGGGRGFRRRSQDSAAVNARRMEFSAGRCRDIGPVETSEMSTAESAGVCAYAAITL